MLSYLQSLWVILVSVGASLRVLHLMSRTLEEAARKRANSVNGWQLTILASIYPVALGFMLSDAWVAFQTASADARNEAAAALTIYRVSNLLPVECAVPLQVVVRSYVQTVNAVEWPTMDIHKADFQGSPLVRAMWDAVNHCDAHADVSARGRVVDALEALQNRRDSRIEDYDGHLPASMWFFLLFGAGIVITSSCLLGNEKKGIHCFHVVSLTILITVMLLTISDLDRPFEGATRVSPQAFRAAIMEIGQPQGH
jgi:hypothetical protein